MTIDDEPTVTTATVTAEQIKQQLESYTLSRVLQRKTDTSLAITIPNIFTNYLGWQFKDNVIFTLKDDTIIMHKVKT